MFKSNDNKLVSKSRTDAHTLISVDTEVTGNLSFKGELIIEGLVVGDIKAADDSAAVLRIAETGRVNGNISVPNAVVNGEIEGDVRVASHLELAAKARITGSVQYRLLEMVAGAQVNGSLVCGDEAKSQLRALTHDDGAQSSVAQSG
tara:strand:- start:2225 stop:2665 length:441 start_codon:yes stop_codon:yes gene_type:complete